MCHEFREYAAFQRTGEPGMGRTIFRDQAHQYLCVWRCGTKTGHEKAGFELYLDDDRLEEKVKVKHTWFVHVPSGVKDGTSGRVPLMLFSMEDRITRRKPHR